jgi:phage terminase large subunit
VSVLVNHRVNPWFPEVLEQERQHCLKTNPDDYDVIWEGACRSAVVGAIYAKEMESALREGRIGFHPYDPKLKVHVVFDLGWNDSMFISFVQRHVSSLRVIDCIKDSHRTLDSYAIEIKDRKYNLGKTFLPHDGFHRDYKTGKTAAEILKAMGFKHVRQVPNETLENGIKGARMTLAQTLFNKDKTAPLVDSLKRYRRAVNSSTSEPGAPLHDDASHGADNYRYISLCADQMTNDFEEQQVIKPFETFDGVMGF